jgi:hypothetical protein
MKIAYNFNKKLFKSNEIISKDFFTGNIAEPFFRLSEGSIERRRFSEVLG